MTRCMSVSMSSYKRRLDLLLRILFQKENLYLDEIDFSECLQAAWLLDIENWNNVLVVEVAKEFHFAQSSEAEHGVIEGSNLLDGNFLSRGFMNGRAIKWLDYASILQSRGTDQTTPYAPSPTTSWISYCSETLKEIFLDPGVGLLLRDIMNGIRDCPY